MYKRQYETLEIEYSIDKGANKTVKLNGDLIFKGVDVDVINLHDITDTITVAIGRRMIGNSNTLIYKGEFTLRDCDVDVDNNEIKLTITTVDYYTQFLDVYENCLLYTSKSWRSWRYRANCRRW